MKLKLKHIIIVICWVAITIIIQGFLCPQLTSTELILTVPDSFICNFKKCN